MHALANGAIGFDLVTLRGQIEVKHISSISQTAVTWKCLQIGAWLPLKLNRKS